MTQSNVSTAARYSLSLIIGDQTLPLSDVYEDGDDQFVMLAEAREYGTEASEATIVIVTDGQEHREDVFIKGIKADDRRVDTVARDKADLEELRDQNVRQFIIDMEGKLPVGQLCACGNEAVGCDNGDWTCARCYRIAGRRESFVK